MTRKRWLYLSWTILMIVSAIKFRPWEGGWVPVVVGIGISMGILVVLVAIGHGTQSFEEKHNIGEARFNSRTGKLLKSGESNR